MKTAHKIIYGLIRRANCKLACIILCALFFCVEYKSLAEPENQQAGNTVSTAPQAKTKPIKYKSGEEFFAQLEAELGYSKPQTEEYSFDDYIVISFTIACILLPAIYICVQIYHKRFKALSMIKPVEETRSKPVCAVEKEYLKIKTSAKEKIRLLTRDKKIQRTAFLAFFAGMALGILLMYMHFSRYEIQNMRGIIVKLDRQSGKIIKVIRDPEIGWEDYKKPNN